eukprot:jgi/Bigna1/51559/estExt_Genewise1Plus.C_10414
MSSSSQVINQPIDAFYNVKKCVGDGTSASVYIAKDTKTGEVVAIKHFSEDILNSPYTFHRERSAMNLVSHRNVAKCIASFADWKGAPAIVLPYAQNGDLLDFMIKHGPPSEKMCRTILCKIFHAIKACHDSGVIHRDIKPENILLDAKYQPIVCDFGYAGIPLSSSLSSPNKCSNCSMTTKCGSKSYMAPEIINGNYQTLAIDIWSLGVLAFILYCGFPPYAKPSKNDYWYRKISRGDWTSFWRAHEAHAEFTSDFKDMIEGMLCINSKKRATLKELLESQWMAKEVLSSEDLEKNFHDHIKAN